MARGSFGRTVARAAASGGSRSYRARPPTLWYLLMVAIVIVGVGLIAYSRYEINRPAAAAIGPSSTDNWDAALSVDICGTIEPNLPASTNLSTVGLRTFGNGLINASPSTASTPANFEGAKATLGLFANDYPNFTLTATKIGYPAKKVHIYTDGQSCTGKLTGKATLVAKVWSSPTAKTGTIVTNPTKVHIDNGEMITVAFVPKGASIPEPTSKTTLIQALGGTAA